MVVHPRRRFGGVGPAIYWQTASSTYLGPRKWGAGPTIVVPKQASGWTYGVLAITSGRSRAKAKRREVNNTFIQPFIAYGWRDSTTLSLNTESTYNW